MIIKIYSNTLLSSCAVKSICGFLGSSYAIIVIHDNAAGCNSEQEVQTKCDTLSVENISVNDEFSIFPNPAENEITITFVKSGIAPGTGISILTPVGQEILLQSITGPSGRIDISNLPRGIYFVRFANDRTNQVGKFIKQ